MQDISRDGRRDLNHEPTLDTQAYDWPTIAEGQEVEFEIETGTKGLHATNVHAQT